MRFDRLKGAHEQMEVLEEFLSAIGNPYDAEFYLVLIKFMDNGALKLDRYLC